MRSVLFVFVISGILASCRTQQPQTQRGAQIGQSTAPLPPDPNAPLVPDEKVTGPGTSVPISAPPGPGQQPPVPGDVGSPNSPAPSSPPLEIPVTPPGDAGVAPDAGESPNASPDAGVWSPPPDAEPDEP